MSTLRSLISIFLCCCSYLCASDQSYPAFAPKIKHLEKKLPTNGRKRPLLPKLLPFNDESYLLEFHSDNCEFCDQMEPVVQRLEDDLGTKIRRINVGLRRDFISLLENIGFEEYGNFPFYFNRRTGQAIGGPTSYLNLKHLGTGNNKLSFTDTPKNIHNREKNRSKKKDMGTKGFLLETLSRPPKKDEKKVAKKVAKSTKKEKIENVKNEKKAPVVTKDASIDKLSASKRLEMRRAARKAKKEATGSK
jgi:thiol-disulfide isomerase/thioredoxin